MLIKENVLREVISDCLLMSEQEMNVFIQLLTEESTWIDEKTQQVLQLKADQRNFPLNSLTSLYRHGLADWLKKYRYTKAKILHRHGIEYVNDFIENKKDLRLKYKSDWRKVIKHRLRHDPRYVEQAKEYLQDKNPATQQ